MVYQPVISLAMIVRNEAEGLPRALASAAAGVDEIIIVDTGSTDNTRAIAEAFTPFVFDLPWDDNFSAARQFAYDRTTGDWILWLDGDDELFGAGELRPLARAASPDVGAICLRYVTGVDDSGAIVQESWRERLTRRGAYTWAGAAHECLIRTRPSLEQRSETAHVLHHGKTRRHENGLERNVRILTRELAGQGARPDSRTLFYLARDTMLLGRAAAALGLFERYLQIATWKEEIYAAHLFMVHVHLDLGNTRDAAGCALAGLAAWPERREAYFMLGELAYFRGEWEAVIAWCDLGRLWTNPATTLFLDPLAARYRWIIFYVNGLWRMGRKLEALEWTRRALAIVPDDPQHQYNLELLTGAAAVSP